MIFEIAGQFASICLALLLGGADLRPTVLVPLVVAGGLALADVLRVLKGTRDVFDARSLLAIVLVVFVLVSPVKQLVWDYWPALPANGHPEDAVAFWAWSWCIGMVAYRLVTQQIRSGSNCAGSRPTWKNKSFWRWWTVLMGLSLAAQAYVYLKFRGLSGYVETVSERSGGSIDGVDPFAGLGPIVAVADGSRYLLGIGLAYIALRMRQGRTRTFFYASLMVLFASLLVLGGLRGSRGVIVYGMFSYVVVYHAWVRRIRVGELVLGCMLFFAFMSSYYFYKFYGLEGLTNAVVHGESVDDQLRSDPKRYVLARDLGRMDVQVLAVDRVILGPLPAAYGRSYLGAPFSVVPALPGLDEPPSVTKEKVELLFGVGTFDKHGLRQTSLLLGQYGELLVNFGLVGVFSFFALLAWSVRAAVRWKASLVPGDARVIFLPAVLLAPIQLVMHDSALLVMFYFKLLLFPALLYLTVYSRTRAGNAHVSLA